jgi:hypothetical protein
VSRREVALAARLRAELQDLERVVARVEQLSRKAAERDDPDYCDGVALNLHGFYAGVERLLEMVTREIDGAMPQGPDWHREILSQCSIDLPGARPAVIDTATRAALDEYRAFRHLVRNAYAFAVQPLRVQTLASQVRGCYDRLAADVARFAQFLEQLEGGLGPQAND